MVEVASRPELRDKVREVFLLPGHVRNEDIRRHGWQSRNKPAEQWPRRMNTELVNLGGDDGWEKTH